MDQNMSSRKSNHSDYNMGISKCRHGHKKRGKADIESKAFDGIKSMTMDEYPKEI